MLQVIHYTNRTSSGVPRSCSRQGLDRTRPEFLSHKVPGAGEYAGEIVLHLCTEIRMVVQGQSKSPSSPESSTSCGQVPREGYERSRHIRYFLLILALPSIIFSS